MLQHLKRVFLIAWRLDYLDTWPLLGLKIWQYRERKGFRTHSHTRHVSIDAVEYRNHMPSLGH